MVMMMMMIEMMMTMMMSRTMFVFVNRMRFESRRMLFDEGILIEKGLVSCPWQACSAW